MTKAPGLAFWTAAIVDRDQMDADVYRLLKDDPRFADVCRKATQNYLHRSDNNPTMARIVRDADRFFYAMFAMYLDARGDLTPTGIQKFCAEMGFSSPGRAAGLLIQLRLMGYISPDADRPDRRVRRYIPKPAMKSGFEQIFREDLLAFSLIEPEAADAADWIGDPDIFRDFVMRIGRGMARIVMAGEKKSPLTPFASRRSGMPILLQMSISGDDRDVFPPRETIPMAVAPLARRFGVSRSHVLRLLREAEGLGLLRRDGDETTGVLLESLREAILYFHAANMMGISAFAYLAHRDVNASRRHRSSGDAVASLDAL